MLMSMSCNSIDSEDGSVGFRVSIKMICAALLVFLSSGALGNPMGGRENFADRPGGDFHNFNAGDPSICSTSCATSDRCLAYTYVISSGVCWMKDTIPERKQSNCCISGVKVMGPREVNTDRPSGNLRPGFPSPTDGQCESACKADRNCGSYTWVKPGIQAATGMCWLKRGRVRRQGNDCCISGVKLRKPAVRDLGQPGSLTRPQ